MISLKRFTTQYKGGEDRILIIGENKEGTTVSFWLTQRLLLKCVPVLADWLQKNNPADLRYRDNRDQAKEMAQVFTRKPVQLNNNIRLNTAATAESTSTPIHPPLLVHSIDLALNKKVLRLKFRHEDRDFAALAMSATQLRQWLAVIHVLWNNAHWPEHVWPRWLIDDTELVANDAKGAFH